ncbi:hypothetical protein HanXRQr2_Chr14g0662201 [Helianthus annuus]|uniref:Uncharacterized protein n=1 Tax=Helianthus annuus TaxID=4232 RepID=A0A9K3H7N1_HELAN|nr:hypothetical protein HanXRQr2_Chr14g0662201 [Helianthus annuus]KAJ0841884.1 hypothetical protein HanPSC8_Chr14g0635471 [Helianthus annuus]
MPGFPSVSAKVRNKPEGKPAPFNLAFVRSLSGVDPQMFSPSPGPLKCHLATFPSAF